MKCKFCSAELEENTVLCPACGKSQEETVPEEPIAEETEEKETAVEEIAEEEAAEEEILDEEDEEDSEISTKEIFKILANRCKKPFVKFGAWLKKMPSAAKEEVSSWKLWQQITAGAVSVLALAVVVCAVLYACCINVLPRDNDLYYHKSYTVSDRKAARKKDVVVATMGDQVLTNGELQAYYWFGIFDYFNQNGIATGVDPYSPLDKQIYNKETGMTYQQVFLQQAIESWRRYAALVHMAKEANFSLTQEQQNYVDSFPAQIEENAKRQGYEDTQKFLDEMVFPGFSVEAYSKYQEMNYIALCYYDVLYAEWMPDSAELEAFYKEHEEDFKTNKIDKSAGSYYDVRHILIGVEGYTDEAWETCRQKAQKILDDFLANEPTEEKFGELVLMHTADTASASNGGLYTQLTKDTAFVETFKQWYMEEGRKPGDTGLVKNTERGVQGYHIMYFVDSTPIWEYESTVQVLSENTSKVLEDARNTWPVTVDYKKIILSNLDLSGNG